MSVENVREYLSKWARDKDIMEFDKSSATVELAAKALGTAPERIAKTISLRGEEGAVMVVAAGDVKIDNQKYKKEFGMKARMLSGSEVPEYTGHEIGGVCPFAVKESARVFLDISLKRFETVFPACGSSNSGIELTCDELEEMSPAERWVDVCKVPV